MTTIKEHRDRVFKNWLEIAPQISESFSIPLDKVKDNSQFEENIYQIMMYLRSLGPDDIETRENLQFYFEFCKKSSNDSCYFMNDWLNNNKNFIKMSFSYKGQEFLSTSIFPDEDMNALTYLLQNQIGHLICFLANEEAILNHISPETSDYYYTLFNLPIESMAVKLHIWKDNFPRAYEKLTTTLEIPTYEEVLEEIKKNKK